ncbi:MAG: YdcF family protein [Caldilineaceae bacterium]|nr:YdcF family protein [Caldilineaceae bacterium]
MRKRIYKVIIGIVLVGALLISFPFMWRAWVDANSSQNIYTVDSAPITRVAVVFGARIYPSGRLSAMLMDRVETAVQLYEAGKVEKLLLSGDNSSQYYNEPGAMMAYALQRGVPAEDIQLDYAGLRTYDTCYRAQAIFDLDAAVLVTQRFHLPRALFTCEQLGMEVFGVAADQRDYDPRSIAWSEMREIPATLMALLDIVRRQPPTFLGEQIPL